MKRAGLLDICVGVFVLAVADSSLAQANEVGQGKPNLIVILTDDQGYEDLGCFESKTNPPGTGWWGRMIEEIEEVQLYDLDADPGESTDVAAKHPEVVAKLMKRIKTARSELGDMEVIGSGARFFEKGPRRIPGNPPQPLSK